MRYRRRLGLLKLSYGDSLGGWVSFLSFLVIVLFSILAFRWIKAKALWRLRNRLIVTYVFIGVIPVVMLLVLALLSAYLFAGQFATFIVTTGLNTELKSLEAANAAIAHQFASQIQRGGGTSTAAIESLRQTDKGWANRQICVWLNQKLVLNSTPAGMTLEPPAIAAHLKNSFGGVVRDRDQLYLRALETAPVGGGNLTVLSSEPFDQKMLGDLAMNLGEVTLYATGLSLRKVEQSQTKPVVRIGEENSSNTISVKKPEGEFVLDAGKGRPPTFIAGTVPPAAASVDRQVTFPTTVFVVDWDSGDTSSPAAIIVQTRVSKLYERLFGALGDFAPTVEFVLLFVAIIFGIIELIALVISYRLAHGDRRRGATLRRHPTRQSRRLQPPHSGKVRRSGRYSRHLVQFDDRITREADRGAEAKAAAGERVGNRPGSAGAVISSGQRSAPISRSAQNSARRGRSAATITIS